MIQIVGWLKYAVLMDKKLAGCPQPALEVFNSDNNDDRMYFVYGIYVWNISYEKVMSLLMFVMHKFKCDVLDR